MSGTSLMNRTGIVNDLVPYLTVHPNGPAERLLIDSVAMLAAKDSSCPACRDAARHRTAQNFTVVRAGRTLDERVRQPRCGTQSMSVAELSAPLFLAAEWPKKLLARKAPYGLKMAGKSRELQGRTLRSYLRNTSQPLTCRYQTCAVVGSAGHLRRSALGRPIDAHDAVIRINAAPTFGYERDVGMRTTWRVHNSEKPWFMASLGVPELQLVVCHTPWIGACQHQAFSGRYSEHAAIINPVLYSQLWGLLGRPKGKQAPSTGLLAIALALGACDSVSLYGFSKRGEAAECAHHYWDCPKWSRHIDYMDAAHRFHDWGGEAGLREKWVRTGAVVDGALAYGAGTTGEAAVLAAKKGKSSS